MPTFSLVDPRTGRLMRVDGPVRPSPAIARMLLSRGQGGTGGPPPPQAAPPQAQVQAAPPAGPQMSDPVAQLVAAMRLPPDAYGVVKGLLQQGLNPAQILQRLQQGAPQGNIPLNGVGQQPVPQAPMEGDSPQNAAAPWYARAPVDPRMADEVRSVAGPNAFDANDVPQRVGGVSSMGNRGQIAQGLLQEGDLNPKEISRVVGNSRDEDIDLDAPPPVKKARPSYGITQAITDAKKKTEELKLRLGPPKRVGPFIVREVK